MKKSRILRGNIYVVLTFCSFLFLTLFQSVHSQIYAGIGLDGIKGFTVVNPYAGMSLLIEKRNYATSIYARIGSTLKKNEDVISLIDNYNSVYGNLSYRYNTLELGRRNYGGNDLEYGFGYYVGEHVTVSYNSVRVENLIDQPIDYVYPSDITKKGNLLSIAVGGNAGVQYSFVRGIIYFELGFNFSILPGTPNNYIASLTNSYSGLNFTLNVGFKKALVFGY